MIPVVRLLMKTNGVFEQRLIPLMLSYRCHDAAWLSKCFCHWNGEGGDVDGR